MIVYVGAWLYVCFVFVYVCVFVCVFAFVRVCWRMIVFVCV